MDQPADITITVNGLARKPAPHKGQRLPRGPCRLSAAVSATAR